MYCVMGWLPDLGPDNHVYNLLILEMTLAVVYCTTMSDPKIAFCQKLEEDKMDWKVIWRV